MCLSIAEEVSKDGDAFREESLSAYDRVAAIVFGKMADHTMDVERDMSSSNTGRENYTRLRKNKRRNQYIANHELFAAIMLFTFGAGR